MVLDIVETLASPALIGRIYNSHMHEDRTLPSSTVTLTDVHGIHRAQSRQVYLLLTHTLEYEQASHPLSQGSNHLLKNIK